MPGAGWPPDLRPLAGARPVVVALPRGGVPVAYEIARALDAPLDVLTVRKLGAPQNPELAVGAVAEDGSAVLDTETARALGVTRADLERILERELRELGRRMERFRDGRPPLPVRGRSVIVVDDGLATGLSDLAAVRALRRRGAARIIVAVPVGSREAVAMLGEEADEVVCLTVPPRAAQRGPLVPGLLTRVGRGGARAAGRRAGHGPAVPRRGAGRRRRAASWSSTWGRSACPGGSASRPGPGAW